MANNQPSIGGLKKKKRLVIYPADCCVLLALLFNFFILLGEPIQSDVIVSLGSQGLIISLYLFAVLQLASAIKAEKVKNAYYVIALLAAVVLSALFSGLSAIFSHLIQLICFFMLPTFLLLYRSTHRIKFVKNAIYIANLIYTVLWIVLSFTSLSHVFHGEYGDEIIEDLTLGYANPNQAGMFLMVSFIIAFSAFQKKWKLGYKAIFLIQSIWLFVLTCQSRSRTCIIILIVLLVLWATKLFHRIGTKFTALIFLLPAIMALILLIGGDIVRDLMVMDEQFDTGRIYVIKNFFAGLSPLTFLFGNFARWIGNNMHNSYLTVFAISGLFGAIAYIALLWKIVSDYSKTINRKSNADMVAFLGVLAVIAHGVTEAAFITAGMIYASLASLLFVLTLNEEDGAK